MVFGIPFVADPLCSSRGAYDGSDLGRDHQLGHGDADLDRRRKSPRQHPVEVKHDAVRLR